MHNPSDSAPLVQTVELKIKPSQVAIAGLTLLAVFGAALLVLRLMDVLILVFVALVIAATLRPMMSALQRRGIPKALAVLLIYLGILGVLAGLFVLVIPVLVDQGGALIRGLPQVYASLVASLEKNPNDVIRSLPQRLPTGDQLASQLQAVGGAILTGALGIGMGVLAFLAQMLSIIILSIYLTLDQSRLERFWLSLAPTNRRPELLAIWREIESRLGSYVRGELLLMTSIGVLAGLGYLGDWPALSPGAGGVGRAARVCADGRSDPWRDSGRHRRPVDLPAGGLTGRGVFDRDSGGREQHPGAAADGALGRREPGHGHPGHFRL